MSKPANTVAIGAFVAGSLLILFSIIFYLSGGAFGKESVPGLVIFDGSVKGLNVGAPVAFKGVQIGEVVDIDVYIDPSNYDVLTPVEIRVDVTRIKRVGDVERRDDELENLIERGLRAQLQLQSLLTGLLYVNLDFHPGSKLRFTAEEFDIDPDEFIVIPTVPTDLERLARTLDLLDIAGLVQAMNDTVSGMDAIVNNPEMQSLAGNFNKTLVAIEQLSARLDVEVETLSPGLNQLIADTDLTMQKLPGLSASGKETLEELTRALKTAQATLESVNYTLSDDSAVLYDVRRAAQEMGAAGRAMQSLAETIETQPEALLRGKSALGK